MITKTEINLQPNFPRLPWMTPTYRRSLQPSKEIIQHIKNTISLTSSNFCPPGPESADQIITVRIHAVLDPDPDPQHWILVFVIKPYRWLRNLDWWNKELIPSSFNRLWCTLDLPGWFWSRPSLTGAWTWSLTGLGPGTWPGRPPAGPGTWTPPCPRSTPLAALDLRSKNSWSTGTQVNLLQTGMWT